MKKQFLKYIWGFALTAASKASFNAKVGIVISVTILTLLFAPLSEAEECWGCYVGLGAGVGYGIDNPATFCERGDHDRMYSQLSAYLIVYENKDADDLFRLKLSYEHNSCVIDEDRNSTDGIVMQAVYEKRVTLF